MTNLPDETAILALHRETDIAIYQRFFDRSISGWRYRCGGTFSSENNAFRDYTALRKNNPGKVKDAVKRIVELDGNDLSMARCGEISPQDHDDNFLLFVADLQRFLSVNSLIVSKHFRNTVSQTVDFRRHAPIYNLIVSLDFSAFVDRVLNDELPILMKAAKAPGLRDDPYSNASGTLRALADMLERRGDDTQQLEVLELSQKLNPNAAKAVRIVRLLHEQGRTKDAENALVHGLLKWPDSTLIKSLAASRQ